MATHGTLLSLHAGEEEVYPAHGWKFPPDITFSSDCFGEGVTPGAFDLMHAACRKAAEREQSATFTSTPERPVIHYYPGPTRWWHWLIRWVARLFGREWPGPIVMEYEVVDVGDPYDGADGHLAFKVRFKVTRRTGGNR